MLGDMIIVDDQGLDYDLELHFGHDLKVTDAKPLPGEEPGELNSDTVADYYHGLFEDADRHFPETIGRCYIVRHGRGSLDRLPDAVADVLAAEMHRRGVSEIEVLVIERSE